MTERLSTGETLLFQSARWIAMGLVLILLLGIGVLGFQYLIPTDDTVSVTYADVERVLSPADASRPASAPLPDNVKRILSGNEKVLAGWLDVLRVDERPQFIQMMSSVITEAEKKKTAPLQSERC